MMLATVNRILLAVTVAFPELLLWFPHDTGNMRLAFPPIVIAALVAAGVAAASATAAGVASSVQNKKNLDAQQRQNLANRALQTSMAQQQAASATLQQDRAQEQSALGGVMSTLQQGAAARQQGAARTQQAAQDMQGSLARAYLTKNSARFGGKQ